jgi:hypothetical protein
LYNQTILCCGGTILVRQLCSSVLAKYVFPQPVGLVMFAVNGCWKRNSFSTSLVAVSAAAVAVAAAAVVVVTAVDIHDCLYFCIGDGGDGGGG